MFNNPMSPRLWARLLTMAPADQIPTCAAFLPESIPSPLSPSDLRTAKRIANEYSSQQAT